jgi:hypothetical protein
VGVAVVLVGAVATGVYMYVRMDDEIRQHVESMLRERYPQLSIHVGGARLIEGRGIAVYEVSLADPSADPGGEPLLEVDELLLACDVELTRLMRGTPTVERVEVKRPQLALRRGRNGRWNVESLLPLKPCGTAPPQVIIRNGVLTVSDEANASSAPLTLRDIHMTMAPVPPTALPTETPTSTAGVGATAPAWPAMRVDGVLSGPHVKRVELHATVAGPNAPGAATILVDQLQVNSALLAWARPYLPPVVRATQVDATLDGKVTLGWANSTAPPDVLAALVLSGGRVEDALLPAPLTELTGQISVKGEQFSVTNLHGMCGAAAVGMSINRNGWAAGAPLAMSMWANNATLDDALYQSMRRFEAAGLRVAGVLCNEWDQFRPAGVVDATLQVSFDGVHWAPNAGLVGRQLSFESEKFPYRLTDGAGTINFTPATRQAPPMVTLELTARGGGGSGQPLRIKGEVTDPKPAAAGWATITGTNLEIDDRMLAAIPNDKCREVINELNPTGKFDVAWMINRPRPGAEPQTSLTLGLKDVRINYQRFPYPLRNISGQIVAEGANWTFSNLVSGGRRPVHGEGYLRPVNGIPELFLRLTGKDASLDVALYDALPESVQRAWTELQPRGEIDFTADISYRMGQAKTNLDVAIQPNPTTTQFKPTFFPYLMEGVAGTITYRDGEIVLREMTARHDRTTVRTNGNGYFWPEGNWQFRLTGLTADNLSPRQDLISALPKQMGKLIDRLRPTGSFALHDGVLEFRKSASEIALLEAEWDVGLDCHQTDLACGIDLKSIYGTVRLKGKSDGARSWSAGELDLESVTFQDVQFTNVRGPLYVDETRCLLGKWATDKQLQAEQPITGTVYDGSLRANAWVTFDNLPEYRAEVHVVGSDLRRMVVERFGGKSDFTGKVDANMMLGGRGSAIDLLVGDGDVHIRDANLYELSLLASLLKILRTGAADKTAFTQSDITYRLQGRHIYLDQIDFLGDVVNLYGKGETTFDQQLSLVFSAVVGRHEYQLPFVKNLMREANQQIMQMYVTGSLSDPHVATEAFPGIAQMLQQIGSDLKDPMGAAERRQQERRRVAQQQQLQQSR